MEIAQHPDARLGIIENALEYLQRVTLVRIFAIGQRCVHDSACRTPELHTFALYLSQLFDFAQGALLFGCHYPEQWIASADIQVKFFTHIRRS